MTLAWILAATLAGGVLSVAVAASLPVSLLSRIVQHLVSLSTGVLLATALQLLWLVAGLGIVVLATSQLRER